MFGPGVERLAQGNDMGKTSKAKTSKAKPSKAKPSKSKTSKSKASKAAVSKAKASKTGNRTSKTKKRTAKSTRRPAIKRMAKLPVRTLTMHPPARLAAAPAPVQHLAAGAGVPPASGATVFGALNAVGAAHNVDPAAIAGVIDTESGWDTGCVTGQYIGLTQVGPEFVQFLKMTQAQFLALPVDAQINAYGTWLDYYRFNAQMAGLGIVVSALPLPDQAAVLQGMQFAPNAKAWKAALAKGDVSVPITTAQQATFLGDTSIGDMRDYYAKFLRRHPPVYA